jgi:hypothetical protein
VTRGINSVLAQAPRKATGKIHGSGFGVDDDGDRSVIPSVKVSLTGATDLAVEGDDQRIFSIQFSSASMRSLPKALAWQQRETVR